MRELAMKKNLVIDISNLLEQVKELRKRLWKESDVGGVLLSTSFLEACLASLLRAHLKKSGVTEKLLDPTSGTLASFSSKCDVAYCLSLIVKTTYQDLLIIGQTRNIFALNHLKAGFNDDDVSQLCGKLKAPSDYLETNKDKSNFDEVKEYFETTKNRFIHTVICISDLLMKETLSENNKNKGNGNSNRLKSLEKTAESIRKELLQTQQHLDISQLKLKTSKSSALELRQKLLDARKRLEIAEAAVKARQEKEDDPEVMEILDLELEPGGGISESQRGQLIDLLDPGPKGNVDILCIMGNDMSETTAGQLEEILSNDGWKTNGVAQSAFSNQPKGVVLVVNSKETTPSYASFLQRVFATIGMEVFTKIDDKYQEWSLSIIVGDVDG